MSCLTLSSHLCLGLPCDLLVWGFHLNIFLTLLVSGILCTWPNQLSLWDLIWLIIFLCFISLSNSSLVLILHIWFPFVVSIYSQLSISGFQSATLRRKNGMQSERNHKKFWCFVRMGPPSAWAYSLPPLPSGLTFEDSIFCAQSVHVRISEQISVISLHSINWLVCVSETECVYCAVRNELIYWHLHRYTVHFVESRN